MGRPAKPIDLLVAEGRKHLTSEEIKARRAKEQALHTHAKYRPSDKVMQSPVALRTFKKLKKLYRDIDYVDGLDENVINRYCLLTADADGLETLLVKMEADIDNCDEPESRIKLYKAISGTQFSLNKVRDMLLKIEDRLFLNPTARIKNVPKQPKEKPPDSRWTSFQGGMTG